MFGEPMSRPKQFKSDLGATIAARWEDFPCHARYLVFG